MSNKKPIKEKALDNKCPSCGAPIHFNPTVGKWKCEYCNSEFDLEEMQKHKNASSIEKNKVEENNDITDEEIEYTSYKCENCGAEIVADAQTSATFCVYCGNTAILKSKLSGKFSPSLIIPFKKEKEQAIIEFQNLAKGRPFIPKDFLDKKNIEKIKGVYIPFWLFDLRVAGSVVVEGKNISHWSRGDTDYTKTDIYHAFRTGTMDFEKVPVDGSTHFDNDIMNSIEPFDYSELIKYNHAYLSGFFAEKYDVESEDVVEEVQKRSINSGQDIMQQSVTGYTTTLVLQNNLVAQPTNKRYVLLPVWMVNVKYKDKMYIFAMNGQTGKFIGNIPIDKKKVILWSIGIFGLCFLVLTAIIFVWRML